MSEPRDRQRIIAPTGRLWMMLCRRNRRAPLFQSLLDKAFAMLAREFAICLNACRNNCHARLDAMHFSQDARKPVLIVCSLLS
jgi:hypothetical protein